MKTTLSIALSTVVHIKDNPYLPYPAVIKFHNITYTLTCCTDPALYSFYICTRQTIFAMLSSNYIVAIHNTTQSPYT